MVLVAREFYTRSFYSDHIFSRSSVCCYFHWAIAIIVPFFIVYATKNFWVGIRVDYEQPIVDYRFEYILYTMQGSQSYGYTNVRDMNGLMANNLQSVTAKTSMLDYNNDGLNDMFQGYFSFRGSTANLQRVQLYVFFNYGFREVVKYEMQDFIRIDVPSLGAGISRINVNGDIQFKQLTSMPSTPIPINTRNTSIFSDPNANLNIFEYMMNGTNRTEYLDCDYNYLLTPSNGIAEDKTEIFVQLRIPPYESIMHNAPLLENAKFAWIQYISIFLPCWFVIEKMLAFFYKNHIFTTRVLTNLRE
jgi:hypothetical protein